jgi:hypothetical protein
MRIQHALRAFTPKDKKTVRTVAETFRQNPEIDTETVITELGIGEALVSTLDGKGAPTPVERILIVPPASRIGPATDSERATLMSRSPVAGRYTDSVDRESAYEMLKARAAEASRAAAAEKAAKANEKEVWRKSQSKRGRSSNRQGIGEAMMKSVARSIGSAVGRKLVRGILGSLLGGR